MSVLSTNLRRRLGDAIKQARSVAEGGARKALQALAVHEPDPYRHMNEMQRDLRRKLRAQAKQLGDGESRISGAYQLKHLVEKLAYDQWHRLLFARFLVENNLLISPDHGVSVSLDDCEDLASSLALKDAWAVAARFSAKELPEIFRADDPAGAVELPVENRKPLIDLVTSLPVEVFTASDSLGWCYQYWQAERKGEVNSTGDKIGADDLPAVTQLFTEDYMVDFLLDNTLGAWHAGKALATKPELIESARSEDEVRNGVALPGCAWEYLRFIRDKDDKWTPAAGTFVGWPNKAGQLKCLDPCMGSGHFVVAMFERLVALRAWEENLSECDAVAAVIRDNIFGLEIDPRCTQIAAFNLALAAWRRVGHRSLPAMNLACSGLAPNAKKEDWLKLSGNNETLRNGMERLYHLFREAPALGSLINPRALERDLFAATFHDLQPLLEKALTQEIRDDPAHEMAIAARGLAQAAEFLTREYSLVITNVPYLGRGKQEDALRQHLERYFPDSKADLATALVERCLAFCAPESTAAVVTPQNWLFLSTYTNLRESLLKQQKWNFVVQLGPNAFRDMNWWAATTALISITAGRGGPTSTISGIDVSGDKEQDIKAARLADRVPTSVQVAQQADQLRNPDARIEFGSAYRESMFSSIADAYRGQGSGDTNRFICCFWEVDCGVFKSWIPLATSPEKTAHYGGCSQSILWEDGTGQLAKFQEALVASGMPKDGWKRGWPAWGIPAVRVTPMSAFPASLHEGSHFDSNCAVIVPKDASHLPAVWCFCSSDAFRAAVRSGDQSTKVTSDNLVKVPFDLAHWQKVAAERYPDGLPKPSSNDPTQWLFNGHPKNSDQPLHVAIARLLGYKWPRQTGSNFIDCPALAPDDLDELADTDGIVCLTATKGEAPAAERLRALLVKSIGKFDLSALIASSGLKGSKSESLEEWLRDEFFEQHCALFHRRPFIWHIWDGHKSGFSALVNYHQLTHANLEKLTYAHLGDWIRRQQVAVDAGESGSDARLQAARQLQSRLKLILEGEPPYDIFVRWKPLSEQAIGWHPDLNDGVRLNIRPFAAADVLRKRVKITWGPKADRGKEPKRDKAEYPWLWNWDGEKQDFAGVGNDPDGNRWNGCHYTNAFKQKARGR